MHSHFPLPTVLNGLHVLRRTRLDLGLVLVMGTHSGLLLHLLHIKQGHKLPPLAQQLTAFNGPNKEDTIFGEKYPLKALVVVTVHIIIQSP